MGRDKGNRTKNNVRPSSSARSAELLNQKVSNTFFNLTLNQDEGNISLDANFQLVLKKLSKKDSTTKQKALQEFAELLQDAEVEAIKAVLPLWAKPYNQLSIDADHRVREVLHQTHKVLVGKARKNLAPYLKLIIGPWFTSQFDTYSPASSAAISAFTEVFSPQKQSEVVAFCQQEILNYIYDAIVVRTPQTLTTPSMSAEEAESKYLRLLTACLHGYPQLLTSLTKNQIKECEETHNKILLSTKVFKLQQHNDPLIRQGYYKVVLAVIQNADFLFESNKSKITTLLVNRLDETDILVLPVIWQACVLNLMSNKELWSFINIEKSLFPKIFSTIRQGGQGCPSSICPLILPLIHNLPQISDKLGFYNRLFNEFQIGLTDSGIKSSPSESKIFISTLFECLKYISNEQFFTEICEKYLIILLEKHIKCAPLINNFVSFVNFLKRNQSDSFLWDLLLKFFTLNDEGVIRDQVSFLLNLRNPKNLNKSAGKVKFSVNVSENINKQQMEENSNPPCEFIKEIQLLAENVSLNYVKRYLENEKEIYLACVIDLVENFEGERIFQQLSNVVNLNEFLIKLISGKSASSKLAFYGLNNLMEDEQQVLLEKLNSTTGFAEFCAMMLKFKYLQSVNIYLMSSQFHQTFLDFMKNLADGTNSLSEADTLLALLVTDPLTSSTNLIPALFEIFQNQLHHPSCGKLISKTITMLGPSKICAAEQFENLIVHVFKHALCLIPTYNNELKQIFIDGLRTLEYLKYEYGNVKSWDDFTNKLACCISETIGESDLSNLIKLTLTYIQIISDANFDEVDNYLGNEEVEEILLVIRRFAKPPGIVYGVSENLKSVVKFGGEVRAICDWKYFAISHEDEETDDDDDDDDDNNEQKYLISGPQDWKKIRQFRNRYLKSRKWEETKLSENQLKSFIKWYTYILNLFEKLFANRLKHANSLWLDNVDNPDFIPRTISKNESNTLKMDFDIIDEAYSPNLFLPIMNQILDSIQDLALLKSFTQHFPNSELNKFIINKITNWEAAADNVLFSLHPDDFELLYSAMRMLTYTDHTTRLLLPNLRQIFFRNFIEIDPEINQSQVLEKLPMCLTDGNVDLLKLTYWTKNYYYFINTELWTKIFIQLDKLAANENLPIKSIGILSSWFLNMKKIIVENLDEPEEKKLNSDVCQMWGEVAEKELWLKMFTLWEKLTLNISEESNLEFQLVLELCSLAISAGVSLMQINSLDKVQVYAEMLLSKETSIQRAAFNILNRFIPEMIKEDTDIFHESVISTPNDASDDDRGFFTESRNCAWTCRLFETQLKMTEEVVEALLSEFKIGDSCIVEPFTDSFTYTHGFLLIWRVILGMCGEAHGPLRFQYACWLRERGHLQILLESIFKLMPPDVLHGEVLHEPCTKLFEEESDAIDISHLSCLVYRLAVQRLSVAVREWWMDNCSQAALVARVTSAYVSPLLIAQQLKDLTDVDSLLQDDSERDKFTVSVYPTKREVVGTYMIDEAKMHLTIILPANYPLGIIKVDSENHALGSRSWRVSVFLIHRNGSVRDALALWKSDLDKKFDGLNECEICFSIFHGNNFDIPKQMCKICRKKFHSYCLYKWFNTSNKSSCPNCRNQF